MILTYRRGSERRALQDTFRLFPSLADALTTLKREGESLWRTFKQAQPDGTFKDVSEKDLSDLKTQLGI